MVSGKVAQLHWEEVNFMFARGLPLAEVAQREKGKAKHFRSSLRPVGWLGTVVSLDWMRQAQCLDTRPGEPKCSAL